MTAGSALLAHETQAVDESMGGVQPLKLQNGKAPLELDTILFPELDSIIRPLYSLRSASVQRAG